MPEDRSRVVELAKYPIIVMTILVALIIAKWTLGISFGAVAEISSGGVKFAQEAPGKLADLEGRLNGAIREIEQLKASNLKDSGTPPEAKVTKADRVAVFAAQQTVSDQTAEIAKIGSGSGASPKKGFVWIGDFGAGRWDRAELASLQTGQPVTDAPDQLRVGTEYRALSNMIVREGLPASDADYFRGRKSLGTIPRGTKLRLAGKPVGIDRQYAVQYWAEIELAGS